MNGFMVMKSAKFNGVEYAAGDTIPADAVLPSRINTLKKRGVISEVYDISSPITAGNETIEFGDPECIMVPLYDGEAFTALPLTASEIGDIFCFMQSNAEEAAAGMENIRSENALMLLQSCDSRSTVKKAAKAALEKLRASSAETEDDTDETDEADGGGE